jgi:hypothetical protein
LWVSHVSRPTIANFRQLWATHGEGGDAGQRLLLSLAVTGFHCESDGRIDFRSGTIGWSIEVNVERKTNLLLESVDFESAQGFVGCDLGTLASPLRRRLQPGSRLLKRVEKEPGATVIDAIVGESVDDLLNASLHGVHVVENRHLEARARAGRANGRERPARGGRER